MACFRHRENYKINKLTVRVISIILLMEILFWYNLKMLLTIGTPS